jgi:3-methylcrotonyl-CoA carboxylase alpha subunit
MPATIVALYKKTGDSITEGEPLLVLEAMKMEHTIYAPKNALIKEIYYQQGQQVQDGSELIELSYDE